MKHALPPAPGFSWEQPARIIRNPATRRWLYGICAAAIPLLIGAGYLDPDAGNAWLYLLAAIIAPAGLTLAAANTPKETPDQ